MEQNINQKQENEENNNTIENESTNQNGVQQIEQKTELKNEKSEEQKQNKQQNEEKINDDDLEQFLEDMENPLNVTKDDKDDENDDVGDPNQDQEWKNFMENLTSGQDNPMMNEINNMMGDIFKNMGSQNQQQNQQQAPQEEQKQAGSANPTDMFSNMEKIIQQMESSPNFDNFANKLLNEFMDKDILYEPIQEAKQSYNTYLETNKEKLSEDELSRYNKQLDCLQNIILTLDNEPENKEKMIQLFEQMQDYGSPPQEILNSMGKENPFSMMQNIASGGTPQQNQGMPNLQNLEQECNIF